MLVRRSGVDRKVRDEAKSRQQARRQMDVLKGLSLGRGAQRGDFEHVRKLEDVIGDYQRFKSPNDRKKITEEYYGRQKEYQKANY